MNDNYLIEKLKSKFIEEGNSAFLKLPELLYEYEEEYRKNFTGKDPNQGWKSVKGKTLEKLIAYIITEQIRDLGLQIYDGRKLSRNIKNSDAVFNEIKRQISIDFGKFGMHLPDADLIVYDPKKNKVKAIISIKASLRERIAQAAYWKLKLVHNVHTEKIKFFLATIDSDNDFSPKREKNITKSRAVAESELDCVFVLNENFKDTRAKVKSLIEIKKNLGG